MTTDWTIMDDIEESMFDDCPKDDENKYIMPDGYGNTWSFIDDIIGDIQEDTIKKLIDDYGIFRAIKAFKEDKGYYAFEDNVDGNDDNDTDVYRILAEFLITMWIVDMDMISEMTMAEYEEQQQKEKEEEAEEQKDDSDDDE